MSRVPRSTLPAWNSNRALGSMQTLRTARNIVQADWQCPPILNNFPERSASRTLGAKSRVMPPRAGEQIVGRQARTAHGGKRGGRGLPTGASAAAALPGRC
jgi:hypothetical protein